jgi:hypothetical protein
LPKRPVAITCNLTGTYNSSTNSWTGAQPAWTFTPDPLQCHNGNNAITWTLTASNVPTGFTASLTSIVFKPTPPWTGGAPAKQTDGTVTAGDNFQNITTPVEFGYTTTVAVTPNPGTTGQGTTFSYDPEVENESGGGKK